MKQLRRGFTLEQTETKHRPAEIQLKGIVKYAIGLGHNHGWSMLRITGGEM